MLRSHICVVGRMFSCLGPLLPPTIPGGVGAPEEWLLISSLHLFLAQYFPGQPLVQNFLHSMNNWLQKQQRKKIPYGFFQTALESRKEVSLASNGRPSPFSVTGSGGVTLTSDLSPLAFRKESVIFPLVINTLLWSSLRAHLNPPTLIEGGYYPHLTGRETEAKPRV